VRILADENVPGDAVRALERKGHDVAWVAANSPGIDDTEVLELARDEGRVLITFDKDFGELAFRRGLAPPQGIILVRISLTAPEYVSNLILTALESRSDWTGHFSVLEDDHVRMTPLPSGQS
jgi:predicted nuclease of predicted toxin-antitoxin system